MLGFSLARLQKSNARVSQEKKINQKNQRYTKNFFKNNGEITPDKKTNQNLIALAFSTNQTSQSPTLPAREALLLSNRKIPRRRAKRMRRNE